MPQTCAQRAASTRILVVVTLILMFSDVILASARHYNCDVSRYHPRKRITNIAEFIGGKEVHYYVTAASQVASDVRSNYVTVRQHGPTVWEFTNTVYTMDGKCRVVFLEDFTFSSWRQRFESPVQKVGDTTVWVNMYFLAGNEDDGFVFFGQRVENGTAVPSKSVFSLATHDPNHIVDPHLAKHVLDVICGEDVDVDVFFQHVHVDPTFDGTCIPE